MAVLSKEELLKRLNLNETDDETLSLMEDIDDTFNTFREGEDWKKKYEDNDADWRKRYKERFMTGESEPFKAETQEPEEAPDKAETITINDLFKIKEDK